MTDIHDFENTVVAVLDSRPAVANAVDQLSQRGYEFEVLVGKEGQEHLDPKGETGVIATIKRLIALFGDQHRILERLSQALKEGKVVVSVEAEPDEAAGAISILRDHGGHYMWKFGEWTFVPIGDRTQADIDG